MVLVGHNPGISELAKQLVATGSAEDRARVDGGLPTAGAALFGAWLERAGPRQAGLVAALCWPGGLAVAAAGVSMHRLWLLWLGGGVLGTVAGGVGGARVTEAVFTYPGLGRLLIQAINVRDYPLIQGCVLVVLVIYVLVNLAVDLLYIYIDPRTERS